MNALRSPCRGANERLRAPDGQEGSVLLLVIVILAALSFLAVIGAKRSLTELQITEQDERSKQALGVAEAGLSHAFSLLKTSANFNNELASGGTGGTVASIGSVVTLSGASYRFRAFGGGANDGYYVRIVDNYDETSGADDPTNDTDHKVIIVSRGLVGGAERHVEALVTATGGLPGGIFGKNSVTFGGSGGLIDSFDSGAGQYNAGTAGSQGDVGSNGTIDFQSDVVDHGSAAAGQSVSCSHSCGQQVTGTTTNNAPPVSLSPDPYPTCNNYPPNNNNGISGGTYYGPNGKKAGELVGGSGDNIVLASGTYCFSSVNISGGGLLTVNGPVTIQVTGADGSGSSFGGGGIVNTTSLAQNLKLISSYVYDKAGLTINGGSQAYMQVFAPGTQVVLGGGTDFYGSIVAGSISSTGGSRVHSDRSLGSAGQGATLSAWHEVRN